MNFLSLKGTLLYCLEQLLFRRYEENESSFTNFSQSTSTLKSLRQKARNLRLDDAENIPLQKTRTIKAVLYTSPLPQLLQKTGAAEDLLSAHKSIQQATSKSIQIQHKAGLIESDNQNNYAENTGTLPFRLWARFEIETDQPGWFAFRLPDEGLADWLEHLRTSKQEASEQAHSMHAPPDCALNQPDASQATAQIAPVNNPSQYPTSQHLAYLSPQQLEQSRLAIWQAQYTHARCTSILNQWPSAPIDIRRPQATHACDPAYLPWISLSGDLQTQSQAALELIHTLIAVVDDMFWIPYRYPNKQYFLLLKRTSQLYQAFEQFYRQCLPGFTRFSWKETSEYNQQMQVNIGLILSTQKVLKALLPGHLGAPAVDRL